MARRSLAYRERSFDPTKPVYVAKSFNGAGRHWKPGDRFDWQKLAVSIRRARQLFDQRKLRHAEQSDQRVDKPQNVTRVDTESGPVEVQKPDELDDITDMKELRKIAEDEGAKTTTSKTLQRKYIRENRENPEPSESVDNDLDVQQ